MTRRSDLPLLDDDCWLDDLSLDQLVTGLPHRADDDQEGIGLRSLIERPEKLFRQLSERRYAHVDSLR